MKWLFVFLLLPCCSIAQWPGYFYSFTLTDNNKLITASSFGYEFTTVKPEKGDIILNVLMCDDSTTIRFYAGGNNGLYEAHKLEITNTSTKEKMVIGFPPSISGGKEKYFRNLFVGKLNFKKGLYQIKLPASNAAWDNLKEKHFCADYGGNDSYWDISALQHQ